MAETADSLQARIDRRARLGGGRVRIREDVEFDMDSRPQGIVVPEGIYLLGGQAGVPKNAHGIIHGPRIIGHNAPKVCKLGEYKVVHFTGGEAGAGGFTVEVRGWHDRSPNVCGVLVGGTYYISGLHFDHLNINGTGFKWPGIGMLIEGALSSWITGGRIWRWDESIRIMGQPKLYGHGLSNAWSISTHTQSCRVGIHTLNDADHRNAGGTLRIHDSIIEGSDVGLQVDSSTNVSVSNTHFENRAVHIEVNGPAQLSSRDNHFSASSPVAIRRTINQWQNNSIDLSSCDGFHQGQSIEYLQGKLRVMAPRQFDSITTIGDVKEVDLG